MTPRPVPLPRFPELFAPDVEREYRVARNAARSRWFTLTAVMGLLLFDAYALVDAVLAPQVLGLSLALRFGLVTPLVLAGLLLRSRRLRAEPASAVDGLVACGTAVLVVASLGVVQHHAPGALGGAYFGGSFVVVVFFVTLLRTDVRWAAGCLTAMLAAFAWGQALVGADSGPVEVAALLAVAVSGLFGLVMAHDVERSERARFTAVRRERALAAEREQLITALAEAAVRDELTGLLNRRGLAERLPAGPVGVLVVDVDHFKQYNDRVGHLQGDRCLASVAAALTAGSRPDDVVARLGGEEFVVVLTDGGDAAAAGERLRTAVRDLALPHPAGGVVTVSVGAATGAWEQAFAQADRAVYAAKAAGRDRVVERVAEQVVERLVGGVAP
ncbi:diguanylate cyclase [Kineococcus aurantiacus]|uniref:Diguanylate cyclase (GGDEF)-like protein n=1 Tax=Kineococcus aurantiacus TaxID=37633 RepID=A0A7Y9DK93_9ACTN|nr:diguanylate cyclase (GGDEF)-like protein [Kineococcus aurantiacus]